MIWVQSYQQKILRILTKFSDLWKFLHILKLCSYQKIPRKIFRNLSNQSCTNIFFSGNFSDFLKTNGGFKIPRFLSENFSELRFLLVGLSPCIQMVRQNGNHSKTGQNRVEQYGCHFVFGPIENLTGSPFRSISPVFKYLVPHCTLAFEWNAEQHIQWG